MLTSGFLKMTNICLEYHPCCLCLGCGHICFAFVLGSGPAAQVFASPKVARYVFSCTGSFRAQPCLAACNISV